MLAPLTVSLTEGCASPCCRPTQEEGTGLGSRQKQVQCIVLISWLGLELWCFACEGSVKDQPLESLVLTLPLSKEEVCPCAILLTHAHRCRVPASARYSHCPACSCCCRDSGLPCPDRWSRWRRLDPVSGVRTWCFFVCFFKLFFSFPKWNLKEEPLWLKLRAGPLPSFPVENPQGVSWTLRLRGRSGYQGLDAFGGDRSLTFYYFISFS